MEWGGSWRRRSSTCVAHESSACEPSRSTEIGEARGGKAGAGGGGGGGGDCGADEGVALLAALPRVRGGAEMDVGGALVLDCAARAAMPAGGGAMRTRASSEMRMVAASGGEERRDES
jgi:hypothetical protein